MATRTGRGGGRLKGFRLADVPIDLRLRAAKQVARSTHRALDDAVRPADRLLARLLDMRGEVGEPELVARAARAPSDRVYWVSAAAWDRVMRAEP